MGTKISWTDDTWNPTTGCSHMSDGCRFCYAETLSLRFGRSAKPWTARNAPENVVLHPERLRKPYGWKKPTRCFVNSMSDLFHELIPFEYVDQVFAVMEDLPQHTFQILTKRPGRMAEYSRRRYGANDEAAPAHIWFGTSVEDRRVVKRIDELRGVTARIRFLSCEPLLGPLGPIGLDGIHWVIAGGESGVHMKKNPDRWMDHAWARELRDLCVQHDPPVAYFFKQVSGIRTEMDDRLQEEDGGFTRWAQYPDDQRTSTGVTADSGEEDGPIEQGVLIA